MTKDESNDEIMGNPAIILEGEDLKKFDEYDKRPLTEKEKALLIEADEFYAEMVKKEASLNIS